MFDKRKLIKPLKFDQIGLDWIGSDWIGLDQIGSDCSEDYLGMT